MVELAAARVRFLQRVRTRASGVRSPSVSFEVSLFVSTTGEKSIVVVLAYSL
jgi:hypothetical protein